MWGNELYNKTAVYVFKLNPMFEKLLKPVMEERTLKDTIKGALCMAKSLQAQINSLIILMNHEYLTLINVTLFKEVILQVHTSYVYTVCGGGDRKSSNEHL